MGQHVGSALAGLLIGVLVFGVLGVAVGMLIGWVRNYGADNWLPVLIPMFAVPVGGLLGIAAGIRRSGRVPALV